MTTHLSIATEGLSPSVFSHRLFASLGFGYSAEVIITPVPVVSGGGGGGGYIYDNFIHYDVTFRIVWNGKVVIKSYRNILFDTFANIIVNFRGLSIKATLFKTTLISTMFKSKLNSSKPTPIDISVNEIPINISVKRKIR